MISDTLLAAIGPEPLGRLREIASFVLSNDPALGGRFLRRADFIQTHWNASLTIRSNGRRSNKRILGALPIIEPEARGKTCLVDVVPPGLSMIGLGPPRVSDEIEEFGAVVQQQMIATGVLLVATTIADPDATDLMVVAQAHPSDFTAQRALTMLEAERLRLPPAWLREAARIMTAELFQDELQLWCITPACVAECAKQFLSRPDADQPIAKQLKASGDQLLYLANDFGWLDRARPQLEMLSSGEERVNWRTPLAALGEMKPTDVKSRPGLHSDPQ